MKRREGREYEGGNQGRAQDERENLRKFFFFFFHFNTETSNLFHIQKKKQRMMNRGQKREGKMMTMTMMTKSRGGRGVKKRLEGQEEEEAQDGKEEERGGEGRFMVAVMQKCKHFATFAENNDTAGRGRCARSVFLLCVCCVCVCVCTCSCVGGCSNSTTGSGRRTTEVK